MAQTLFYQTGPHFTEPNEPFRRNGTLQGKARFTRGGITARLPIGPQLTSGQGPNHWIAQGWTLDDGGLDDAGGGGAGHTRQGQWPEKVNYMPLPIRGDKCGPGGVAEFIHSGTGGL